MLSTASFASFVSAIGAPIGAPIAGIAAVMGLFSTTAGASSERLTKHEKTVSLAESKHLSVSRLVSKALTDGSITDVEFNLILREIDNYYSLKGQLRREEKKIENISSDESLRQEFKKKIQQKLGSLIDINA